MSTQETEPAFLGHFGGSRSNAEVLLEGGELQARARVDTLCHSILSQYVPGFRWGLRRSAAPERKAIAQQQPDMPAVSDTCFRPLSPASDPSHATTSPDFPSSVRPHYAAPSACS